MKLCWYIPPVSDDAKKMREAVKNLGMEILKEKDWPTSDSILFYGSIEGMKVVQDRWGKGGKDPYYNIVDWCDWNTLKCSYYFSKWGGLMLAQHYGFYPLGEVLRLGADLWRQYADTQGRVFVRPDANDKCFTGGVVHQQNLKLWINHNSRVDDTILVLLARPEPIHSEYRLVVANGKVAASSRYMKGDNLDYQEGCPPEAVRLAELAAARWSPHPVFVLDIAARGYYWTPHGVQQVRDYLIVECGSVHTSGLYECDFQAVARAMAEAAEEE